jgi:hypothetical protein
MRPVLAEGGANSTHKQVGEICRRIILRPEGQSNVNPFKDEPRIHRCRTRGRGPYSTGSPHEGNEWGGYNTNPDLSTGRRQSGVDGKVLGRQAAESVAVRRRFDVIAERRTIFIRRSLPQAGLRGHVYKF